MYNLGLNFAELKSQDQTFYIYRKKRQTEEVKENDQEIYGNRLPVKIGDDGYENYWVSFKQKDGFEKFECYLGTNYSITKRYLISEISKSVESTNFASKVLIEEKNKNNRVKFIIKNHGEGDEMVWLEPYYLLKNNSWGYLIDFKFERSNDVGFSRRVQVLSLSLNSIGRSNTEIASDKYRKIQEFARIYYLKVFKNRVIDFSSITEIESDILDSKKFICAGNNIVNHQNRMRNIGPYKTLDTKMNIIFLHKETERKILATFYDGLVQELKNVFKCKVELHGERCDKINSISIDRVINTIKLNNLTNCIVVVLKKNEEEDNDMYYEVKYKFCIEDIPVQFINYNTLKNKYSVRDFSLQIFSKVGGIPWIVDASSKKTLIIGLAQSIKFEKTRYGKKMKRFYAYSILMDNQGLFHSIKIISDKTSKDKYLEDLRSSIINILDENIQSYSSVVIHAPFKITRDEISKIKQAVNPYKIDFLIIRLNQYNKFYGFNKNVNTLIPFEASLMPLSDTEYLLWTEGITKVNKNPTKRYSNPIYIDIMYKSDTVNNHKPYLQDLINLSGMNWRAYNSKSVPLSIQYCRLVTDFVQEFQDRNYPELTEDNLKPWFL